MLKPGLMLVAVLGILVWPCGAAECGSPPRDDLVIRAGLLVGGLQAQDDGDRPIAAGEAAQASGEKSAVRAMLLSAILPGLGEVYAAGTRGYVTGSVMAAADVFSFWQYLSNNDKGEARKEKYQQFASVHYDRDRLDRYARDTIAVYSGSDDLGFCRPGPTHDEDKCTEQVKAHFPLSDQDDNDFYQQIDADDKYIFGWDDWTSGDIEYPETQWTGWSPGDSIPRAFRDGSPTREVYRGMRQDADDFFARADRFAWVMVIGRVVSIVDSAILVKIRNRDLAGFGTNPRLCFAVDPVGDLDMRLALKMRF